MRWPGFTLGQWGVILNRSVREGWPLVVGGRALDVWTPDFSEHATLPLRPCERNVCMVVSVDPIHTVLSFYHHDGREVRFGVSTEDLRRRTPGMTLFMFACLSIPFTLFNLFRLARTKLKGGRQW